MVQKESVMKLVFLLIFVLFSEYFMIADEHYPPERNVLCFDADGDGKIDTIVVQLQKIDPKNAVVDINITPTSALPLKFRLESYVNFSVEDCHDGCIKIVDADYGIWSEAYEKYYDYDPARKSWFLKREVVDLPVVEDGMVVVGKREQERYTYDMSERIDGKMMPDIAKYPLSTLERRAQKGSKSFFNSVNQAYLQYYLDHFLLDKKSVVRYNNIAYYLQKRGRDDLAIFLLEKIVAKFPQRAVAYLNLADAYRADFPKKSRLYYKKYVERMRSLGKAGKIPKRVLYKVSKR